jgi:hypothetical protein
LNYICKDKGLAGPAKASPPHAASPQLLSPPGLFEAIAAQQEVPAAKKDAISA